MSLWYDLRFAVRLLIKNRWFTIVAATALALGIGVNTAVFTFVNAVLIRGLPFDDPDRIIALGTTDIRNRQLGVSRLDFEDWRESAKSFSALALMLGTSINVSDEGRPPEQYQGVYQSSNLFPVDWRAAGTRSRLQRRGRQAGRRPSGHHRRRHLEKPLRQRSIGDRAHDQGKQRCRDGHRGHASRCEIPVQY
jgi:hypothetical protein